MLISYETFFFFLDPEFYSVLLTGLELEVDPPGSASYILRL